MKKHVKIYMNYYDYGEQDLIMCEHCEKRKAVDIHHIKLKSQGGNDNIQNLIALCRSCHEDSHDSKDVNKINELIKNKEFKR